LFQKVTKGKVTDESGTPLPGANVLIKGTTTGVQTDFNGNSDFSGVFQTFFSLGRYFY
jgi:hypothetical protein